MLSKRYVLTLLALTLLILSFTNFVLADDRINMPPYHFGGDTLYCDQENGCTLLNMTGQLLWNWPQADIAAAFEVLAQSGQNTVVDEGEGTHGPAILWVIPGEDENGNRSLCLQGIDEWGKQNEMCFKVTSDWLYQQAPLPDPASPDPEIDEPPVIPDCSKWSVGDAVIRKGGGISTFGFIDSINSANGTVFVLSKGGDYTAGCDEIKLAK
jgi:hypothetical protein